MEDVNRRRRFFLFLSKLASCSQEINSREIRLHLTFSSTWIKRHKVCKSANSFKSDVFAAVTVVDAKAP